jgi:hypothetical protein
VQEVKKADVTGSVGTIKDTVLKIKTDQKIEEIFVEVEDYYVSLKQPLGNIVLAALEPESQSSFPANYFLSETIMEGEALPLYRVTQNPKIQLAFEETACPSGNLDSSANINKLFASKSSFVTFILFNYFCISSLASFRS